MRELRGKTIHNICVFYMFSYGYFAGGGEAEGEQGWYECVCVGRVSCLTQSVQAHVSVRVSVSQQSDMSDTKCQFQGTKSLYFFASISYVELKETDCGGYFCMSGCQGRKMTIIQQGRLYYKNMLMCLACVCMCVCMWQEGNTWWCCSSRGDRELSQSAP